jgi:dethiobiotin synthetase
VPLRGLFVTGTDTGAGKTVLSACLTAAMRAAGETVRAHKPVLTGLEEDRRGAWPNDAELLAAAAGMRPEEVAPLRFGPAVSPHLAAELAGVPIDASALVSRARAAAHAPATGAVAAHAAGGAASAGPVTLIVEGVGGLLVPLSSGFTVRDLAAELGLGLLIAARPGLGTINHTLLTLEAAAAAGLEVRAVVLTPWPAQPGHLERSNRETIERLGAVEVAVLETLAGPDPGELARAGATLPWQRWCEAAGSSG